MAQLPRVLRCVSALHADLRAQRVDLMIPTAFASLIGILADRLLLYALSFLHAGATDAVRAWSPALRPALVGGLCACVFLVALLRPFWRCAWRATAADAAKRDRP